MAGEEYTLTKIIRNWDEYILPWSTQRISKKIFWTWCDWDCVIEYDDSIKWNTFLEAREYNFNNLTICSWVKLRFCWTWIPVIRVKENFNNYGTICLRNPLLSTDSQYAEPYSKMVLCSCKNDNYSSALSIYNNLQIECLKSTPSKWWCCKTYSADNSKDMPSKWWCWWTFYAPPTIEYWPLCEGHQTHSAAWWANTEYAGGWWWSWWYISCSCISRQWTELQWCPWCPAVWCNWWNWWPACNWWNWWWWWGFWMCNWWDWWYWHCWWWYWWNAIYWNAWNWWCWCIQPWWWWCSYYWNWWMWWRATSTSWPGWCSVFGNWWITPNTICSSCSQYVHVKWWSSVFWNWWNGAYCACDCWCWITWSIAWWWIYDIWLYAKSFSNNWSILWNWNKWISSWWARWAKMHFVYSSLISNWTITCAWNWCPDWCVVTCQI